MVYLSLKKLVDSGDLVVGQNFRTKDDLLNVIKQWNIANSLKYHVQCSNHTFVILKCVHAHEC